MTSDRGAAFLVDNAIVENLPHQPAEAMRNCPNRLGVSEPDDQASIHELKDTAFGLHRGIGGLIEQPGASADCRSVRDDCD